MNRGIAAVAASVALLVSASVTPASAISSSSATFGFYFTEIGGFGDNASFQFTTEPSSSYLVTGISGYASFPAFGIAGPISGPDLSLVPPADDLLFPNSPPYVDGSGIAFDVNDAGNTYGFILNDPPYTYAITCSTSNCTGSSFGNYVLGTLDPTPLPATLPLFASGLGLAGLLGLRRKKKGAAEAVAAAV